jgi:hypothetical protein
MIQRPDASMAQPATRREDNSRIVKGMFFYYRQPVAMARMRAGASEG